MEPHDLYPEIRSVVDRLGFLTSDIMTAWNEVKMVEPSPGAVQKALAVATPSFRYIPTVDSGKRIQGIVEIKSQELLAGEGMVEFTNPRTHLIDTVGSLCERYGDGKPTIIFVGEQGSPLGLVEHSDLNKPEVSVMLYAAFSEFESKISSLIAGHDKGDWWVPLLGGDEERLRQKQEDEKRNGVDLDLMHCANLSDKITVVSKTKSLRVRLGYDSRTKAEDELGSLEPWRNRVSHRSGEGDLLHNRDELGKLSRVLNRLDCWLNAVKEL